jgi:sugar phosphate isomerase/epimerase
MPFDRRRFLKTISTGAVGLGVASSMLGSNSAKAAKSNASRQEPLQTASSPVFQLGLAAYSFKPHFEFNKGKAQNPLDGKPIDMFGFIDYCANQHCAAELTSYFFPPDADEKYFHRVKRYAYLNGVPIVGTAIGNNFTIGKGEKLNQQIADAKLWIDRAVQMGAPHIRFFAGTREQLEAAPDNMKIAIESLQQCVDYAAKSAIFIGVENHGKLTAAQVLEIVKGIDSDWFGVNLDTGNFISDDPYADLAKCAPFAVNVQVKIKMINDSGKKYDADLERVSKILADANYRGNVVMEYEEEKPFENVAGAMSQLREYFGS